jgi:UDPglucose 6-dehydrogenase
MNDLHNLFTQSGSNSTWEQFTEILQTDPRMGKTHMQVPGPDGSFGFGGHCFPKDTKALLHYANKLQADLGVLKTAVKLNDKVYRNDADN